MSSRWMDHHRKPRPPSRLPRALAWGLACPLAFAAFGWLIGQGSSSPGFFGADFDAKLYAIVGGFAGLVVAPVVVFVIGRRP